MITTRTELSAAAASSARARAAVRPVDRALRASGRFSVSRSTAPVRAFKSRGSGAFIGANLVRVHGNYTFAAMNLCGSMIPHRGNARNSDISVDAPGPACVYVFHVLDGRQSPAMEEKNP
jgi:hypothetical protein